MESLSEIPAVNSLAMAMSSSKPLGPPAPISSSYKPDCSVTELPAGSSIDEILHILDRDGGVILEGLVSNDELANIQYEIAESRQGSLVNEDNEASYITPRETVLVPGLVGKSSTMAHICERSILVKLQDAILSTKYTTYCEDLAQEEVIDPLLSISMSLQIGPGAPRQRLHRDDHIFGATHTAGPWDRKKECMFACLIAGVETKRENGATMFVPGSHKWGDGRQPKLDEVCFAEMKPGSAFIFLASSYHGGGHNSVPNFTRIVHGLFFIRGNLRQEENQFLAIPRSKVATMSPKMLSLLGYKQPKTVLGIVDNKCPTSNLREVFKRANS